MVLKFDKKQLFDKIEQLEITKEGNQVVTRYYGRVKKRVTVSDRYEIFDFTPFVKEVVNKITKQFNITGYELQIYGGRQQLKLISDYIDVQGTKFYKAFYILNSSDKSRRLQINFGLWSKEEFYTMISNQGAVSKKHLTGLNDLVDTVVDLDSSIFDEEIKLIEKLMNRDVMFSKVREVILGLDKDIDFSDVTATQHRKLESYMYGLSMRNEFRGQEILRQRNSRTLTEVTPDKDFEINAYYAFRFYLWQFRSKDSYEIKKETERILGITRQEIRENKLQLLLDV